jgi:hypothetical protein
LGMVRLSWQAWQNSSGESFQLPNYKRCIPYFFNIYILFCSLSKLETPYWIKSQHFTILISKTRKMTTVFTAMAFKKTEMPREIFS